MGLGIFNINNKFIELNEKNINVYHREVVLNEFDDIELLWKALETRSDNSIFTSWDWIRNWLVMLEEPAYLVVALNGQKVVGLGFFVEKVRYAFGLIKIRQWWLHKLGEQSKDQIWIEYNDFLLDSALKEKVRMKMADYIFSGECPALEVVLGLSKQQVFQSFNDVLSSRWLNSYNMVESIGHLIRFSDINQSNFNSVWSKNTRYKLKRSKKLLSEVGHVEFRVITEVKELESIFDNIATFHIKRWGDSIQGSGFNNPNFYKFHRNMILNSTNKVIQVSALSVDGEDIGYLMNYVYDNKVYFYLSALSYGYSSNIKIGLLLHSETIKFYHDKKIISYDFLAGDAQYKRSLASISYEMVTKCYAAPNLALKLEYTLRQFKHILFKSIGNQD